MATLLYCIVFARLFSLFPDFLLLCSIALALLCDRNSMEIQAIKFCSSPFSDAKKGILMLSNSNQRKFFDIFINWYWKIYIFWPIEYQIRGFFCENQKWLKILRQYILFDINKSMSKGFSKLFWYRCRLIFHFDIRTNNTILGRSSLMLTAPPPQKKKTT